MVKVIGGAQEGEFKAVASGTLPNGKPVVVNADGTVSAVTTTSATQSIGSPTVFDSTPVYATATAYDANAQKIVIAYRDGGNSSYGTAIVGTVSGTSISFGTPVVFESSLAVVHSATYDENAQKIVISYWDATNSQGQAIVGTVSGTSISFGSAATFNSSSVSYSRAIYDANAQKIVIAYRDSGNSNYGTAIVGTISGTSLSFGSETVFESANSPYIAATFDSSNNKVVIAYQDDGDADDSGTAIVGTVSGTSISFGSPVVFRNDTTLHISAAYDSNLGKVVLGSYNSGSTRLEAVVGTVSGTSISFGTAAEVGGATSDIAAVYDANAQKVVIAYTQGADGKLVVGTVSGTSITLGSPVTYDTDDAFYTSIAYDANATKVVIAYGDDGNSSHGTSVVFQAAYSNANLTSENYIGMSRGGSTADGSNASIDIIGSVSTNQLSLTAGQQYYVQTDGTIGLTAADPSVLAGTAISATSLVVKT